MTNDYDEGDGYIPQGIPSDAFSEWNSLFNHSMYELIDLVSIVTPKVKQWTLHGSSFTDVRVAKKLAGRLLVFYSGVRVVQQESRYFILYWTDKEPTIV